MADRMNIKFTIEAVDRFSRTMNNLERKLDNIQRQADQLDLSRRVDIDVDTSQASAQLAALQAQIDSIGGGGDTDIDVTVNSAGALAELARIRAAAEAINTARIRAEVDADVARAELERLRRQRDDLNNRPAIIDVLVRGYKKFRTNMDRIATTGRNVGEIVTNSFMGIATTFSTTLVPIISSATGTLGSLGVMAGTTGGAALGLTSALASAGSGFGLFALAGTEVIGTLFGIEANMKKGSKEWYALSQNTRDAVGEIGKFQLGYRTMMQSFREPITDMFIVFMQAVNGTLEHFEPIVAAAVGAMGNLVDSFAELTRSDDMHAWFIHLEQTVGPAMEAIGGAVMNFMMGFLNLMRAFGPLSVDMQNGLLAMSESFRAWSDGLNSSTGFQKFTDYVRKNWPVIRAIFADGIMGLVALFTAFAPYAEDWMAKTREMMASFRAFAEGLGQNQQFQAFIGYIRDNAPAVTTMIGDMIQFLVQLGIALAPVGAVMVRVASAILNFMTNILKANPELGEMLGWIVAVSGGFFTLLPIGIAIYSFFSTFVTILGMVIPAIARVAGAVIKAFTSFTRFKDALLTVRIAMMMIGGPVMWIIGILLLLVPVFMKLWQSSEQFRTILINAFNAIKTQVSAAISAIVSFVMSTWGTLVAWWQTNGEMIKQAASNVWSVISTVIVTAMNIISSIVKAVWPVVQMLIVSVWNNIKGVISGALTFIMGLVQAFAGLFTGNWSAMWEGIKAMFSGAVQFLWNAVQLLLWGKLLKGVAVFAGMFRTAVTTMWTTIKTAFTTALTAIRTGTVSRLTAIRTFFQTSMTAIRTLVTTVWTAIKTAFTNALNAVKSRVTSSLASIRSAFTSGMNAARSIVTNVLNAIRNFFSSALSAIRSRVTSALSSIRSAFTSGMNAVRSVVTNVMNAVRNFFSSALSAIRSRVTSALSSIRSAFSNGMNAARSVVTSALNAIRNFFTSAMSNIISRVTSAISRMRSAFSSGLNAVKSIVSGAVNRIKALFNIDLAAQGRKIVESVARGITGAIGKVTGAIGKVTEKIRNFLPFSPAKEGALRDLDKLNFGGTMAKSITRQTGTVRRAMASVMEAARPNVDYAVDNAYTGAGPAFSQMHANRAQESRTIVEVPVYLHGREIARASNDEQNRINAREEARRQQFSRTGGVQ